MLIDFFFPRSVLGRGKMERNARIIERHVRMRNAHAHAFESQFCPCRLHSPVPNRAYADFGGSRTSPFTSPPSTPLPRNPCPLEPGKRAPSHSVLSVPEKLRPDQIDPPSMDGDRIRASTHAQSSVHPSCIKSVSSPCPGHYLSSTYFKVVLGLFFAMR